MDAKAVAPDKPFFLYYAPGAAHAPHHAPKDWIESTRASSTWATRRCAKRRWPARRRWVSSRPTPSWRRSTRSARPRPARARTASRSRRWTSRDRGTRLSDDEKRLFARMAEVYAGFLSHADHQVGRLLDYLEMTGQRENTLIIVVSDNGASGEGGPDGSVNEMKFMNGIPDDINANLAMLDELGGPDDLQPLSERLGDGVQHAVQDVEALRVQRRNERPVHHLLAGRHDVEGRDPHPVPPRDRPRPDGPRRARRRSRPSAIKGHTQSHFDGVSMRYSFDDAAAPGASAAPSSTRCSARAGSGTTAGRPSRRTRRSAGWSHFNDDAWELYHTEVDRSESHDLAAEQPDKLREMVNLWYAEAGANDGFPLDDRSAFEIFTAPRPQLSAPRATVRLLPGPRRGARGAGGRRPRPFVRDRRAGRHPGARCRRACCSSQGSRFGGHALYVKDNRLHYVNSFVGMFEQKVVATEDLPTGTDLILSASFEKEGNGPSPVAEGTLSLYHGETEGRRGPDQDPARRLHDRRRRPRRRARRRRPGDRGLPGRAALSRSPAARSSESRST